MLSPNNVFAFMSELPVVETGQLLLVTGIAFAIITLIASTYRFHTMIQLNEEALVTVEDCNNFFFINVTRYLSKINRVSTGFGVVCIQFRSSAPDFRPVQEELLALLNGLIREECDKACLFREDCVALIIDTEEDRVEQAAERITKELARKVSSIPSITAFRTGVSAFPMNGLSSQEIIDAAANAMENSPFGLDGLVHAAPTDEDIEVPDEEPDKVGELTQKDKNSALDPLTGVLKAEAIGSYMRKYLAEIRMKKKSASVLCVGINQIDNLIHLQDEEAAETVIVRVAAILQRLTRESDLIGRYDRDDFLVLAPCSIKQGEQIAIRVREAVQQEVILFEGRQIRTTVSVGVSAHPEHGRTLRELFDGAYAALDTIRGWKTSSCLVYDPAQHKRKKPHESASKTRR